jgi:hypothetical protein
MAADLTTMFERRLGKTIPESDTVCVEQILSDKTDQVLDYIGRDTLPERLNSVVVELALFSYNKRGAEGEDARTEGGISRSFDDLPPDLRKRLENYPRRIGFVKA